MTAYICVSTPTAMAKNMGLASTAKPFGGKIHIPEGALTPHPQCFSGHDHLKTDEDWPIMAYRAFYCVDKAKFARYNKGRSKPQWMIEGEEI